MTHRRKAPQDRGTAGRPQATGLQRCSGHLQAVSTDDLAGRTWRLLEAEVSRPVTREALGFLKKLFGTPQATGSDMAGRAVELVDAPDLVAASVSVLAGDLLASLNERSSRW